MGIYKTGNNSSLRSTTYSTSGESTSEISSQIKGLSSKMFAARVIDIVLDDNHPKFPSVGRWSGIGAIYFEKVNSSGQSSQDNYALPYDPSFSSIPLVNEIVLLLNLPNKNQGKLSSSENYYYLKPLGIWNHPHHNAYPSRFQKLRNLKQINTLDNTSPITDNIDDTDILNSPSNKSQNTFIEKSNIYPLMPFMGDNIIEGRFGQSIRLGSTAKSNSSKKNNWSESGENGDPIIILRNGQPKNLSNEPGWIPTIENIRNDLSSIYLTSTQKLKDFVVAGNENYNAFPLTSQPSPPSQFTSPQIAINSDRVVINAQKDSILLSAKKSISLSVGSSVGITTPSFYVGSNMIRLGGSDAKEPILKGNITVELLKSLTEAIDNLAQILEVETNWPEGKPVTSNNSIATNARTTLKDLLNQLNLGEEKEDSLKSFTTKVK
jgi:hypothetical protein